MKPPSRSALIKYGVARILWSNRTLFGLLNKLRSRREIFNEDFDILFDGFPRSGNTFGAAMLLVTQKDRIKVVTHNHKPSNFFWAARIGRPTCLTLRSPVEAIPSWIIYTDFTIQKVIDYYIYFYEVLFPDRAQFLVLPFSVVTGDFPLVLQLINMRFGMNLDLDFDIKACSDEALSRIDTVFSDKRGVVDKSKVARPDENRKKRNAQLREELLSPRYSAGLARCQELHDVYESEFTRDVTRLHSLVRR